MEQWIPAFAGMTAAERVMFCEPIRMGKMPLRRYSIECVEQRRPRPSVSSSSRS